MDELFLHNCAPSCCTPYILDFEHCFKISSLAVYPLLLLVEDISDCSHFHPQLVMEYCLGSASDIIEGKHHPRYLIVHSKFKKKLYLCI